MSAPVKLVPESLREADYVDDFGTVRVEVRRDRDGGVVQFVPQGGEAVELVVRGDTITMRWGGPNVRLEAPDADLTLAARNVRLQAEDSVTVDARREVDIHSGTDVEVRADHHVNLWGHGVLVGD